MVLGWVMERIKKVLLIQDYAVDIQDVDESTNPSRESKVIKLQWKSLPSVVIAGVYVTYFCAIALYVYIIHIRLYRRPSEVIVYFVIEMRGSQHCTWRQGNSTSRIDLASHLSHEYDDTTIKEFDVGTKKIPSSSRSGDTDFTLKISWENKIKV